MSLQEKHLFVTLLTQCVCFAMIPRMVQLNAFAKQT